MAKQRVLVVDDETTICRVLQRFLTKRGCDVTGAGSVEEAVGHLGKEPLRPRVEHIDPLPFVVVGGSLVHCHAVQHNPPVPVEA